MYKSLVEIKERLIISKMRGVLINLQVWLFIPELDILFVAIDWTQCSFERTTTARRVLQRQRQNQRFEERRGKLFVAERHPSKKGDRSILSSDQLFHAIIVKDKIT